VKIIFYKSKIYLIFCKNSAGYQDKSSVSQIWYQCQVYENCQQVLKFQKTDCISNRHTAQLHNHKYITLCFKQIIFNSTRKCSY
jgi:hypothetical protein